MKLTMTIRLLAAVCVLAAVIWLAESRFESTAHRALVSSRVLGDMHAMDASFLRIQNGDIDLECARRDGVWRIQRPISADADEAEIARILGTLDTLNADDIITATQRADRKLDLNDYGLKTPRASITIKDGTRQKHVLVGADAVLGEQVYVQLSDSDSVIATSRIILGLVPSSLDKLRNRPLLRGDSAAASRIEIRRRDGGFVKLVKTAGAWTIQQPIVAPAASDKVAAMLSAAYGARIARFVWDPPAVQGPDAAARSSLAAYDLTDDDPLLGLTVWSGENDAGDTCFFGRMTPENPGEVYARRSPGESVYSVNGSIVAPLMLTVEELRDRKVLPMSPAAVRFMKVRYEDNQAVLRRRDDTGWVTIEPVLAKADDRFVDELVQKLCGWEATAFVAAAPTNPAWGLDSPTFSMEISSATNETPQDVQRLEFGTVSSDGSHIFARRTDSGGVISLPIGPVAGLLPDPANPFLYRSRTMLSIDPSELKELSITRNGRTQTVARTPDGYWIPAGADTNHVSQFTNQVDQQAVEDVVFNLASLQATRLEGHASNPSVYGLDRKETSVIAGISGTEISKCLVLGFLAGTDGVYAMIQGQDIVFVLDKSVADQLTRELLPMARKPAPKPAP